MKKITFLIIALITLKSFAQLPLRQPDYNVNNSKSTNSLLITPIQNLNAINTYLTGPGVTISNVKFNGQSVISGNMLGYYQLVFGFPSFGIDSGIIISSGGVSGAMGPNNSTSTTFPTGYSIQYFDSSLQALVPNKTVKEAAVIEFDFTPITDTIIACKFVFGSEEYPEFVNTAFNDVFGFFITGPMPQGGWFQSQNLAVIPNTNTPICIDSVNHLTNTQYYITNTFYNATLQYDGYTVPITLSQVVTPGQTYHFKVGVADCGDASYDSGVFMKIKSFYGYASMPIANFNSTIIGNTVTLDNTTNWAKFYVWHFGDGSTDTVYTNNTSITHFYANDGRYDVVLEAHNYYQIDTIIQNIQIGSTVGINNAKGNTFELVNANTDNAYQLNISLNFTQNVSITITNISGQKVKEISINNQKEISQLIDLNEFSRGIYIIKVNTAENSFVKKVINR